MFSAIKAGQGVRTVCEKAQMLAKDIKIRWGLQVVMADLKRNRQKPKGTVEDYIQMKIPKYSPY